MRMSQRNLTVVIFCHKSTNGTLKCRLYIDIIFDNHRKFFNSSHGRPGELLEYLSLETRYQLKSCRSSSCLISDYIKYTEHYWLNILLTDKIEHIGLFTIQPVKATGNYYLWCNLWSRCSHEQSYVLIAAQCLRFSGKINPHMAVVRSC